MTFCGGPTWATKRKWIVTKQTIPSQDVRWPNQLKYAKKYGQCLRGEHRPNQAKSSPFGW